MLLFFSTFFKHTGHLPLTTMVVLPGSLYSLSAASIGGAHVCLYLNLSLPPPSSFDLITAFGDFLGVSVIFSAVSLRVCVRRSSTSILGFWFPFKFERDVGVYWGTLRFQYLLQIIYTAVLLLLGRFALLVVIICSCSRRRILNQFSERVSWFSSDFQPLWFPSHRHICRLWIFILCASGFDCDRRPQRWFESRCS